MATISSSSGEVTGVAAGTATVSYRYTLGCTNYATAVITVNALTSVSAISGSSSVIVGENIVLTDATAAGSWSSQVSGRVSLAPSGGSVTVTGLTAGTTVISYTLSECGNPQAVKTITVLAGRQANEQEILSVPEVVLYPNPTTGAFSVKTTAPGTLSIYSAEGRVIAQYNVSNGSNSLALPQGVSAGSYICRFNGDDGSAAMVRLVYIQ